MGRLFLWVADGLSAQSPFEDVLVLPGSGRAPGEHDSGTWPHPRHSWFIQGCTPRWADFWEIWPHVHTETECGWNHCTWTWACSGHLPSTWALSSREAQFAAKEGRSQSLVLPGSLAASTPHPQPSVFVLILPLTSRRRDASLPSILWGLSELDMVVTFQNQNNPKQEDSLCSTFAHTGGCKNEHASDSLFRK